MGQSRGIGTILWVAFLTVMIVAFLQGVVNGSFSSGLQP